MKIEMKRFFTNPFLYMGLIWACIIGYYIHLYQVVKPRDKKVYAIYEKIQEKQDSISSSYDFNKGVLVLGTEIAKSDSFSKEESMKVGEVVDSLHYIEVLKRLRLNEDLDILYKELDKL